MEEALMGSPATDEAVREAAQQIGEDLVPMGDVHGSAEYRREMARVVARRAVMQAIGKRGSEHA
jgi:carbon-monoxide dehydrogenase medium subunit